MYFLLELSGLFIHFLVVVYGLREAPLRALFRARAREAKKKKISTVTRQGLSVLCVPKAKLPEQQRREQQQQQQQEMEGHQGPFVEEEEEEGGKAVNIPSVVVTVAMAEEKGKGRGPSGEEESSL